MAKSTSAKPPQRKDLRKVLGQPRATFVGARKNCHKIPEGRASFGRPEERKTSKSQANPRRQGQFLRKHMFFSVFCASHIPRRIPTRAEKKTKIARSRGGAQRNSYGHGTTSAQKARVAKKTMFFARASGRQFLVVICTEHMKFLRKSRKKRCATLQKGAGFLQSL